MPKEQITWPQAVQLGPPCEHTEIPCSCPRIADTWPQVNVRWAAAGHDRYGNVQISLVEYEKPTWDEYSTRLEQALNEVSERMAVRDGDILKEEKETFSAVLSRSEINEFIKVLRRARDQAYGRDE